LNAALNEEGANIIGDIKPVSVESIEVLKGTSAMIYGSRGYGGAILINAKIKLPEIGSRGFLFV
jgi:TonB-dependent SusC/RagA subfamily outer membrane receptor